MHIMRQKELAKHKRSLGFKSNGRVQLGLQGIENISFRKGLVDWTPVSLQGNYRQILKTRMGETTALASVWILLIISIAYCGRIMLG